MTIIEQLNKLPINTGEYLVLPNLETPYFIIPLHSRTIFLEAVRLVKPKNRKGWVKKIALQCTPFILLRKLFPVISIKSKHVSNGTNQLILPWNQEVCSKFTLFNYSKKNTSLLKIGFGKYSAMIRNEYESILKAVKFGENNIPEILNFTENKGYSILETVFYKGVHPNELPTSIATFLNKLKVNATEVQLIEHPYISRILEEVLSVLKKEGYKSLLNTVTYYSEKYKHELVPVVLMHSDCSLTNVIKTEKRTILIDWEECVVDGVPIDVDYFNFRMQIDKGKSWTITNAIDFLVVLHYLFLQIKHENSKHLDAIAWQATELDFHIVKK